MTTIRLLSLPFMFACLFLQCQPEYADFEMGTPRKVAPARLDITLEMPQESEELREPSRSEDE